MTPLDFFCRVGHQALVSCFQVVQTDFGADEPHVRSIESSNSMLPQVFTIET